MPPPGSHAFAPAFQTTPQGSPVQRVGHVICRAAAHGRSSRVVVPHHRVLITHTGCPPHHTQHTKRTDRPTMAGLFSRVLSMAHRLKIKTAFRSIRPRFVAATRRRHRPAPCLSLIHISEPTRRTPISYAVF